MQTWLLGILIVGGSVLVAQLGSRFVRRRVPLTVLEEHHEVAGFIIGVLGAIYAVLLAFVVIAVWDQFSDAKTSVTTEANQLTDLSRMAQGLPEPARERVLHGLKTYAQSTVDDEWGAMAEGQGSRKTQETMDNLWRIYREIEPQTNREIALYAESLDRLTDLSDSRRLRVHASGDDIPTVIQILLWGGGLVMLCFTYLFGVKNIKSQTLMTAALAGQVAFILFLVVALDNPFHGNLRISSEPIRQSAERIESLLQK
jgi:hypothetical protein